MRVWHACAQSHTSRCSALTHARSRQQQRTWASWRAYTTAKLARAAGAVPARRHIGTHMPHTAHLALATLPILLQAARRWQDAHAERSGLPAPRRPLGTLGTWLHGACQQRNAQGECTGPTALHRLGGSHTASLHAATTQVARVTSAACIQRIWRRRVARTRCLHATLQLQAALR